MLNNWSEPEVSRAENSWGQKLPQYTLDMFNFAIQGVGSWLDLGCGFGRFLDYLNRMVPEADYIGYDSSAAMAARIKERFFEYAPRIFHRDITLPINNAQESVICSAVLIHITLEDQLKVMNNIRTIKPKKITFDINSPSEKWLSGDNILGRFERQIKGAEGAFRMTWQSHYAFTRQVLQIFEDYQLSTKFYRVQTNRFKVAYFLERGGK